MDTKDQGTLLNCSWLENLLLTVAIQFDDSRRVLLLPSGRQISNSDLEMSTSLSSLLAPLFEYANSLAKLQLDSSETALLAALLLLSPGEF